MRTLAGIVVVLSLVTVGTEAAAPPDTASPTAGLEIQSTTYPVLSRLTHSVGDLWCSIANDGTFGAGGSHSRTAPPAADSFVSTSFEYPAHSGNEFLFLGGLWVGGIVGDDTLVSMGMATHSDTRREWNEFAGIETAYNRARGEQTFTCRYDDTTVLAIATETDGAPHRPLGIQVDQVSREFVSVPFDRFVLLQYTVRNTSSEPVRQVRVGFALDGDVFNQHGTSCEACDDISGYLEEHQIAYSIDADGDPLDRPTGYTPTGEPIPRRDTTWYPGSACGAIGIAPIFIDPAPACTTFNWWGLYTIDWGPTREYPREGVHPVAPRSDAESYRTMGNGEIDYDQMYGAIDMSADGWHPPPFGTVGKDVANGLDTRFVLAYCFGDLAPGDSIRLVMVLAAGDSAHREPTDFAHYFDPAHPEIYRSLLDFSDLIQNVQFARTVWHSGFNLVGAAPAELTLTNKSDRSVRCTWSDAPFREVTGYRLYRRRLGDSTWTVVTTLEVDHISFVDKGLIPGVTYEYAVSSLYGTHEESPRSRTKSVRVGFPLDVPTIKARNTPHVVGLNWTIPTAGPTYAPYEFLNIYRRTDTDSSDTPYLRIPIRESSGNAGGRPDAGLAAGAPRRNRYGFSPFAFIDDSVTSGVTYYYSASLTNTLGLEGEKSGESKATPMLLDRRGIVLFNTPNHGDRVNLDSVWSFYAAWAVAYGFDTLDIWNVPNNIVDARLPLTVLSHYQCAILVSEEQYAGFRGYMNSDRLETYFASGGRGILVARNHIGPSSLGGYSDYPDPLIEKLLGIRRVLPEQFYGYYGPFVTPLPPPYYFAARFIGAKPLDAKYPAIEGDSLEAWSVRVVRAVVAHMVPDSLLFGAGYVISVGAAGSIEPGTDVIYTYESAYDTSVFQGKPVGLRRITDSSGAILFNFPLSLMKHEAAWRALTLAVADLGIDTSHVESPPPITTTAAIIHWLYHPNAGKPRPEWDQNHDGVIDVRDVVESTKRIRIDDR